MRRARLRVAVACAVTAMLAVAASQAAAAQYTIVDLGPQQGTGAASTFEGVVIGISPSGNQVVTNCGAWEAGTYVHGTLDPTIDTGGCNLGAVNSSDEVVGEWGTPLSGSHAQAFSESPIGAADDPFLTGPIVNEHGFQNPSDSAEAIDDAGEIGGGALNQPPPNSLFSSAYIFDPHAPSGHQVQLFNGDYNVFGLWPDWAEIETSSSVTPFDLFYYVSVYDRLKGKVTLTDIATSGVGEPSGGVGPGSSLASDGTLVGFKFGPACPTTCDVLTPTMRLADGAETTLDVPSPEYSSSAVEDVNASHYSVGEVQSSPPTQAALWTPTGTLELLQNLIPAGSGWVLQNAVAIADDGAIAGTGTLHGTPANFLLTNNSLLPTATTGACVPAAVAPGKTANCTFTVADTTPGATQRPTGKVTVSSDQPGTIAPTSACTLAATASAGKAACAVSYTPTQNGAPTLTGSYSGDGEHGSSRGTATLTVGSCTTSHPTVSGTTASASISFAGPAGSSCTATFSLSVVETLSGNKITAVTASKHKPKKHKRTVVLGTARATIAAGKTKTVSVAMNGTGKRLLTSRHKLSVRLTVSQTAGASSTFTVKFVAKKRKHK